ncbi:hypothetical protein BsWGS_04473 [Bradybaena similaris]
MSSDIYIEGQTTKRYGLPLSHLEYSYIEKCTNVRELEKIVTVLRSGEEGKFPDLEMFAEKRLITLNPKSRILNKERPVLRPDDLESGDWRAIEDELKTWTHSMQEKDSNIPVKMATTKGHDDVVEVDENLPPIRSSNIVLKGKKQKKPDDKKKKKVAPRDYKEWDKFDVDAEVKVIDSEEKTARKTKVKGVPLDIDSSGMTEEEKDLKANREKDKGNEAFKSQDYDEAVTYYTRSISLMPIAASYNNRALAYLKLKKWDKAIRDCNSVLNIEVDNIKALMRRGTAYKSKHDFKKACKDLERVLNLEPNNKKAEDLLKEVNKEMAQDEKERKDKGGRRLVIEEVDSDDNETVEEIDVDKPVVNGYGNHDSCGKDSLPSAVEESDLKRQVRSDNDEFEIERQSSKAEKSDLKTQENINHVDKDETNSLPSVSKGSKIEVKNNTDNSKVVPETSSSPSLKHKQPDADSVCGANHSSNEVSKQPPVSVVTESAINVESAGTSQDNSVASYEGSSALPASVAQSVETSALTLAERPDSSLLGTLPQEDAISSKPQVSFSLNDSVAETTQAALPVTSDPSAPSIESDLPRLQFLQLPLPFVVSDLKEKGNSLFRSGQYGEAIDQYSQAIVELEKDSNQHVNLSVLLSNRAVCHLKTGNLSQAVSDCTHSLTLVPHGSKTLLRRATAYEGLEKYAEAYVDYKHVISLDTSADQAHQGATRCQSMLQQKFGLTSWREKIPPLVFVRDREVPLIVDQAGLSRSMSSTVSLADKDNKSSETLPADETMASSTLPERAPAPPQQTPVSTQEESLPQPSSCNISNDTPKADAVVNQCSKEQEFESLKTKGNQYVQKGQYQEAVKCYSSCISMCPDQVASYTNRALCYLKLNKASDAEADCDKALGLQSNNPKALYRRALARKMCQKYKLSLQDLIELLKLEPKNSAAQTEIDAIKQLYKEELEMLKKKATAEKESKIRKRVKIEEVDDEEEEDKPRSKASDKVKGQSKMRSGKQPPQSVGSKSKISSADKKQSNSVGKKQSPAHEAPVLGQPVAPSTAPRLMKTTPYEFCQAWNSLKSCPGIQPYADILRQIPPADLPSVISNKLDGQMLQIIVRCVYEEMVLKGDVELGYQILDRLCLVPRFPTVSMFMTSKEKKEVAAVLDILSTTTPSAWTSADIVRLKKEYSVK